MPQTLLALLALASAGMYTLSQQEASQHTTEAIVQDEFELVVAGTLLHAMEYADSRAFDEATTPSALRLRMGLPLDLTEEIRDTLKIENLPLIRPEDLTPISGFGKTPLGDSLHCDAKNPLSSPGCNDISDLHSDSWQALQFETPNGDPLPVEVRIDVAYVERDDPDTPVNYRTLNKRVEVYARSPILTRRRQDHFVVLRRVISYDPVTALEYLKRPPSETTPTCTAESAERQARIDAATQVLNDAKSQAATAQTAAQQAQTVADQMQQAATNATAAVSSARAGVVSAGTALAAATSAVAAAQAQVNGSAVATAQSGVQSAQAGVRSAQSNVTSAQQAVTAAQAAAATAQATVTSTQATYQAELAYNKTLSGWSKALHNYFTLRPAENAYNQAVQDASAAGTAVAAAQQQATAAQNELSQAQAQLRAAQTALSQAQAAQASAQAAVTAAQANEASAQAAVNAAAATLADAEAQAASAANAASAAQTSAAAAQAAAAAAAAQAAAAQAALDALLAFQDGTVCN